MMADVPKVKMIHQREGPSHMGRPQNHQPSRRQELFKPARSDSHDTTKNERSSVISHNIVKKASYMYFYI